MSEYRGLLFIGDPHLASRAPGARKDDYPRRTLRKFAWCLDYASEHQLLPCVLGDLFDKPRDNENWLVGELCGMLVGREVIGIFGNHDCKEDRLGDGDTLTILVKARLIRLVSDRDCWKGLIGGRSVVIGGTSYGSTAPQVSDVFWDGVAQETLVFWMTHHDLLLPEYASGRIELFELPGIHVVVNGHIHSRCAPVTKSRTQWINPGNISRVKRSSRDHVPAALSIHVDRAGYSMDYVEIPHEPFEEVFHPEVRLEDIEQRDSAFVLGLAELQQRRTSTGEGLRAYLARNAGQFEPEVEAQVIDLAEEVLAGV